MHIFLYAPEETPLEKEQYASAAPVATVEAHDEIRKPEDDKILLLSNSWRIFSLIVE